MADAQEVDVRVGKYRVEAQAERTRRGVPRRAPGAADVPRPRLGEGFDGTLPHGRARRRRRRKTTYRATTGSVMDSTPGGSAPRIAVTSPRMRSSAEAGSTARDAYRKSTPPPERASGARRQERETTRGGREGRRGERPNDRRPRRARPRASRRLGGTWTGEPVASRGEVGVVEIGFVVEPGARTISRSVHLRDGRERMASPSTAALPATKGRMGCAVCDAASRNTAAPRARWRAVASVLEAAQDLRERRRRVHGEARPRGVQGHPRLHRRGRRVRYCFLEEALLEKDRAAGGRSTARVRTRRLPGSRARTGEIRRLAVQKAEARGVRLRRMLDGTTRRPRTPRTTTAAAISPRGASSGSSAPRRRRPSRSAPKPTSTPRWTRRRFSRRPRAPPPGVPLGGSLVAFAASSRR